MSNVCRRRAVPPLKALPLLVGDLMSSRESKVVGNWPCKSHSKHSKNISTYRCPNVSKHNQRVSQLYRCLSSRLLETRDTCETRDICTFRSGPRTSSTVSWRPATIFVFLAPVRCKVAGKCHENASRPAGSNFGNTARHKTPGNMLSMWVQKSIRLYMGCYSYDMNISGGL